MARPARASTARKRLDHYLQNAENVLAQLATIIKRHEIGTEDLAQMTVRLRAERYEKEAHGWLQDALLYLERGDARQKARHAETFPLALPADAKALLVT